MIVDVKILHKILANEIQQRVKKKSDLMTKWALSQGLQFKLGWASLYSPRWQDLDFPPLTPTPVWYRPVQANARWMKGHQPIRVDFVWRAQSGCTSAPLLRRFLFPKRAR